MISFTEKKKPKSKKEKSTDVCENVSDLLAQMTLQSSLPVTASIQPQSLASTSSDSDKSEVLILDSPVSHKQLGKDEADHRSLISTLPHAESEAVASPSLSSVIDALHLSDIDWDALSFTSSPTPQANHTTEEKKTTGRDQTQGKNPELEPPFDVEHTNCRSAEGQSYTECPLRDRLLMRNTAKTMNQMGNYSDVVSKHLNYELASPENNSQEQFHRRVSSKGCNDSNVSERVSAFNRKEPLADGRQCGLSLEKETRNPKETQIPAAEAQKLKSNGSKKKYKFVSSALSSSCAPQQRCRSDSGQSNRKNMSTTKKSVCSSVCSFSEDSDVENHQSRDERPRKTKPGNKIKSSRILDIPLKPISVPKTTKLTEETTWKLYVTQPTSQSHGEITENKRQDIPVAKEDNDVFLQTPVSPVPVLDVDDSVLCSDSPLPLAERLRLKFLK